MVAIAKWINHVAIATSRNGTTTHTVDPSSTGTVVAGAAFTPTAGNLLVCVVQGGVTSTTPSGWTLPSGGSAVASTGLYVWYRTAAGSDTFTTTHNASNYPVVFHIMEFAAGSTFVSSAAATAQTNSGATPSLTGLTGTNFIVGAVSASIGSATTAGSASTWSPGTEMVDTFGSFVTPSGWYMTDAYLEDSVLTTATLTNSYSDTAGTPANTDRLTFAVKVAGGPPTYPAITLRAPGVTVATGTAVTAINPVVPASATTGDLSVLCAGAKPYTTTIGTPSGWTKVGEATNGTVASAADVGSTKIAMFVQESAAPGAIGNMTFTGADSAMAVIHTYAKGSAYVWDFSAFTSGGDTVNDANYSATGGVLPVGPEDWVVCATAVNTDLVVGFTGQAINGLTGATMTKNIRTTGATSTQGLTTTGNDSKLIVTDAEVTDGSSVTPPTFTYTSTSVNSGTSMWLRLRQTLPWWVPGKRTQQAIRRAANW